MKRPTAEPTRYALLIENTSLSEAEAAREAIAELRAHLKTDPNVYVLQQDFLKKVGWVIVLEKIHGER